MRRKTKKTLLVLIIIIAGLIGTKVWYENSWKTYRDEVNGFEVKFPRTWGKGTNFPETEERLAREGKKYIHFHNNRDSKWGRHNAVGTLISKSPFERLSFPHLEREVESIIVDGIPAEKEILRTKKGQKILSIEIYFERNNRYYRVNFDSQQDSQKDLDLFDKIVSSFKFIEEQD